MPGWGWEGLTSWALVLRVVWWRFVLYLGVIVRGGVEYSLVILLSPSAFKVILISAGCTRVLGGGGRSKTSEKKKVGRIRLVGGGAVQYRRWETC